MANYAGNSNTYADIAANIAAETYDAHANNDTFYDSNRNN